MELDSLPQELTPIIQLVPDWFEPKKLALAFEAIVDDGSVLVCSVDLRGDLQNELQRKQLRASLLDCMESNQFQPNVSLSTDQIRSLLK